MRILIAFLSLFLIQGTCLADGFFEYNYTRDRTLITTLETPNQDSAMDEVNDSVNVSIVDSIPITVTNGATSLGDNRKVVASSGSAEQLASSTSCKTIFITAELDNTGVIVVGGSNVVAASGTRRGTPLESGDSMIIEIDNLEDVWLDTTVNGDGVTYTYSL